MAAIGILDGNWIMRSIGYYPGCSLGGTAAEYDRSLRALAAHVGVTLQEVPDWVCCGATSAHALDHDAALCLSADNLAKARRAGLDQVLAPCAMCYQRLAVASHEMKEHPGLARRLAAALGEAQDLPIGDVRPLSLLNWLESWPDDQFRDLAKSPLKGLKVACYYGCLLVRPPKVTGAADAETPRSMERVVQLLGAQPVRWSMALECCGGSFAISRKSVVLRQGRIIYESARRAGADVICLACPMCHANLDMRQGEFGVPAEARLPVVYLTQLMNRAFGLSEESLGFEGHFIPVEPVLSAAASRA
jgi:heterodisulfide reductase subunit B